MACFIPQNIAMQKKKKSKILDLALFISDRQKYDTIFLMCKQLLSNVSQLNVINKKLQFQIFGHTFNYYLFKPVEKIRKFENSGKHSAPWNSTLLL